MFPYYPKLMVVHRRCLQQSQDVLGFFSILVHFGWAPFLQISKDVYQEVVCLFYSNLYYPTIPEGTKHVLRSHLLDMPIKFFVSSLYDIWTFPTKVVIFSFPLLRSFLLCPKLIFKFIQKFWPHIELVRKSKPLNSSPSFQPSLNGLLEILSLEPVTRTFFTHFKPSSCMPWLLIGNWTWAISFSSPCMPFRPI